MRPTFALRQWCLRLTLFTRDNCGLCDDAKQVMSKVWDRRPFEYTEINVMAAKQEKWKALYEFDTPVIHIDKVKENNQNFETSTKAGKLMHRFSEAQLEKMMDDEMMKPADDTKKP